MYPYVEYENLGERLKEAAWQTIVDGVMREDKRFHRFHGPLRVRQMELTLDNSECEVLQLATFPVWGLPKLLIEAWLCPGDSWDRPVYSVHPLFEEALRRVMGEKAQSFDYPTGLRRLRISWQLFRWDRREEARRGRELERGTVLSA